MSHVRQAAVAGSFYPAQAPVLQQLLHELLATPVKQENPLPKVLIVPHAGYIYSGKTAASAYALLNQYGDYFHKVVLLGPSHRVGFSGLAIPGDDYFTTPLGDIEIDRDLRETALQLPQVQLRDDAHALEHSLEVQLPFLQTQLSHFSLLPIVVGDASTEVVARVLQALWGDSHTLIVISTDLSHFLSYAQAKTVDHITARLIMQLAGEELGREQACGRYPLRGLLALAAEKAMRIRQLDLCNSGDTAGDKNRVVGYGSWALFE